MNDLLPYIKNEFPQFWDLPISMDDIEYPKSGFDAVNALLILDCILSEHNSKGLAIVLPDDPGVLPVILTECLLSLLMYDILQAETDAIGSLHVGDTAGLLSGRKIQKGVYKGRESRDDGEYYRIEVKGCEYLIPESRKWRIKPFTSASIKGRKRQGVAIAGEELEALFGQQPGEILSAQKSKLLLVTAEKSSLKSSSRSLKLGNDEFEALFPMADFTAPDRSYPVGRNPLGREPLVGFVSAPDVAADIATQDRNQRLLVIEGKSKLASSGSIERIRNLSHKPSLLFLLGPDDDEELKHLADTGVDTWVWTPSDFKRITEGIKEDVPTDEHPFSAHRRLLDRLSRRSETVKILEPPSGMKDSIQKVLSALKEISSQVPDRLETGKLIGSCHRMLRDLSQLSIPMNEYEAVLEASGRQTSRFDARLEALQDRFAGAMGFGIPMHLAPQVKDILSSLASIHSSLKSSNPKWDALLSLTSEIPDGVMSIVCGDRDQAFAMRRWERMPDVFVSVDQSGFPLDGISTVVVSGWLSRAFAKKSMLAPADRIIQLLYPHELAPYENFNKYSPMSAASRIDERLRKRMFGGKMQRKTGSEKELSGTGEDMQAVLDMILSKFHPSMNPVGGSDEPVRQAHLTVFDDSSYTYFTKDSRLDRLDRQAMKIEVCDISEISSGDEIIVTEGSRELFDQMVKAKLATPEYRKLADTASLWQVALRDHFQRTGIDLKAFAERLGEAGCKRKPATVKKWLDGKVINPEDNALECIAQVTGDERLRDSIPQVRSACKAIHSLLTRIGYLLVRKILDAKAKMEDGDLDDDLRKNIEDYANNARILTVQTVSTDEYPVPQGMLGEIVSIS